MSDTVVIVGFICATVVISLFLWLAARSDSGPQLSDRLLTRMPETPTWTWTSAPAATPSAAADDPRYAAALAAATQALSDLAEPDALAQAAARDALRAVRPGTPQ